MYPIITDPFTIEYIDAVYRFVKNGPVTYWNSTDQQCVEQLINNKWEKLSYEESSRIAKLYVKEYNEKHYSKSRNG